MKFAYKVYFLITFPAILKSGAWPTQCLVYDEKQPSLNWSHVILWHWQLDLVISSITSERCVAYIYICVYKRTALIKKMPLPFSASNNHKSLNIWKVFYIKLNIEPTSLWTGIELTTPVVIGGNENILATTIPHHDHNGLVRLHEHYVKLSVCVYIVLAFCIIDFSRKYLPIWTFSFHRLARDNRTIYIGQTPIK